MAATQLHFGGGPRLEAELVNSIGGAATQKNRRKVNEVSPSKYKRLILRANKSRYRSGVCRRGGSAERA